jgi:claudin
VELFYFEKFLARETARMGNSGVQILALLLTMVTFVMILIACILPFWRRNDLEGEVIETIRRSSGT